MLDKRVIALLAGRNFASIATSMYDGAPHVTHVWIDYDQKHNIILVNSAIGRIKERNTRKDNRVAVSIINSKNPYETASILGVVVEKVVIGAQEHFNNLAKKYLNLDKYPIVNVHEERVILKNKPEKVYYMSIPLTGHNNS